MDKTKYILQKIKTSVKEVDPQSEVVLFGSRARGEQRSDSDWDILILINMETTYLSNILSNQLKIIIFQ